MPCNPLLTFFQIQLDRILASKESAPQATGPKKPTLTQIDLGLRKAK
jgi:hypothetical protein